MSQVEREFEIWAEGYCDNGTEGRWTAPTLWGRQVGDDFLDACRKFAERNSEFARYLNITNGVATAYTRLHPCRPSDRGVAAPSEQTEQRASTLHPAQVLDLAARCGVKGSESALLEFAALVRDAEPLAPDEMRPAVVAEPEVAETQTSAARDVLAERRRQIEVEGWTPARDDRYTDYSLARAAATYAIGAAAGHVDRADMDNPERHRIVPEVLRLWPASWPMEWFKPKSRRADLVKAGALILAEIERLDRIAPSTTPKE